MRVAQVAPLYESVPPKFYGGTERVVSYLTEELVRQGHKVTLFASGDSITSARLIAPCSQALRLDPCQPSPLVFQLLLLEHVARHVSEFDLIHFHIDCLHFPWARLLHVPSLTTLHGRLDLPDLVPLFQEFREMPVVSISNAQRGPLPWLNWMGTVYHGLPENLYRLHDQPGKYLAFLGRISPEKGVDQAIEIARQAKMEIRIAAKVDAMDRAYFEQVIKPMLDHPLVTYMGEIGEEAKDEFLGNAFALLAPVNWPEPFGLVMIEAMACGTPVIAYPHGSVPELIKGGITGFIVRGVAEAVKALNRIPLLSRKRCRQEFENRFTVSRMVRDYVAIYEHLSERKVENVAVA